MNQLLEYALKYIPLDWQVFPLCPGQKIPFPGTHGVKDATSDETQIRAWWEKWPDANIAVACGQGSGVYVVDVDVTEAGDVNGYESLKEFPPLPGTIVQATPRGGFHAFYKTDSQPANRNSFRPGIDIRGDGYYVVIAPSIHPNGGQYFWKEGCAPWECQPAEFPEFMRPTTKPPWAGQQGFPTPAIPTGPASVNVLGRASLYLAECEAAIQGQCGHDKLLWAAVAMIHGFLLSDDQAFDLLAREYNPRCIPPWDLSMTKDGRDFRRKVTEARKLVPSKPRGWLLEDDTYAIQPNIKIDVAGLIRGKKMTVTCHDELATVPALLTSSELEFLTHPTGLLGEICEWINATSIKPQPILTLACVLPFLGALFGRKIRDSLGSRTNLYCMGVAPSSAGKAHAPNQVRKLCEIVGCVDLLGGSDVASDSAIEERMSKFPTSLFLWDEIGFLLSHIRSGLSQHHVRIVPLLMKLYSAAGSVYKGREYAEMERQRVIVQPCCCIYGTSTPERFCTGISPEEIQDGWLSRCLVFLTCNNPPKERHGCDVSPPQEICERIKEWAAWEANATDGHSISPLAKQQVSGDFTQAAPEQIIIPRDTDAEKLFLALEDESLAYGKSNPHVACLWTKAEENARRIALICAASESFNSPRITASAADYACRLVRYLLLSFGREVVPAIVTCQVDMQKQKLLKIIGQVGVRGCPMRTITRAARWSNRKQRDSLLADLIEAEEVAAQVKGKAVHYWTVENYREYLAQQAEGNE